MPCPTDAISERCLCEVKGLRAILAEGRPEWDLSYCEIAEGRECGLVPCSGESTASESFLDIYAGRIIGGEIVGGEIVFERFRGVAEWRGVRGAFGKSRD
jgi:hypothetical protein